MTTSSEEPWYAQEIARWMVEAANRASLSTSISTPAATPAPTSPSVSTESPVSRRLGPQPQLKDFVPERPIGDFLAFLIRTFILPLFRLRHPYLILSIGVVFYIAYHRAKRVDFETYLVNRAQAARIRAQRPLWNTGRWWVLALYIDQWLSGKVPGDGMWTRDNAASLRAKKDKYALKELVRMGIFPLFIQDGTKIETTQEREGSISPWGWISWPLFKQSEKRAVFEFAVPRARGWAMQDEAIEDPEEKSRREVDRDYMLFVQRLVLSNSLRRATRWRVALSGVSWNIDEEEYNEEEEPRLKLMSYVSKEPPDASVPYEVGATSRFEPLLPFKPDRILRPGKGYRNLWPMTNYVRFCNLLQSSHIPVVRIEAPDSTHIELDKEILILAQRYSFWRSWDEDFSQLQLREAYRELGMDPSDIE